jgi:translation initiation factor 2 gamma subunit (eIF-2gamma)
VEVRNHWRRDVLLGEDASRSRNATLLANVALIRSALLALLAQHHPDQPLPQIQEHLHSRPHRCLALLNS